MKTCDDLIKDFDLNAEHCNSCHDEIDEGYQDPQPIIINGVKYDTPCCSVNRALCDKGVRFDLI